LHLFYARFREQVLGCKSLVLEKDEFRRRKGETLKFPKLKIRLYFVGIRRKRKNVLKSLGERVLNWSEITEL